MTDDERIKPTDSRETVIAKIRAKRDEIRAFLYEAGDDPILRRLLDGMNRMLETDPGHGPIAKWDGGVFDDVSERVH